VGGAKLGEIVTRNDIPAAIDEPAKSGARSVTIEPLAPVPRK
jgi:hypothetical protein